MWQHFTSTLPLACQSAGTAPRREKQMVLSHQQRTYSSSSRPPLDQRVAKDVMGASSAAAVDIKSLQQCARLDKPAFCAHVHAVSEQARSRGGRSGQGLVASKPQGRRPSASGFLIRPAPCWRGERGAVASRHLAPIAVDCGVRRPAAHRSSACSCTPAQWLSANWHPKPA